MTPTPSQIVAALTVLANKRELFADSQNGMDAWALQYDACELIQKLQSENAALTSDLCKWRSAIQGMTPGGSEYMTVQSVEDFARNQKIECSKAKMESARLAKENAAMRGVVEAARALIVAEMADETPAAIAMRFVKLNQALKALTTGGGL